MNSARGGRAPDFKPAYEEPKPQEHCEVVCERRKELGEKLNVEKDMSKEKMTKSKKTKSKMTKGTLTF
jgi:hypothetical protein